MKMKNIIYLNLTFLSFFDPVNLSLNVRSVFPVSFLLACFVMGDQGQCSAALYSR